MIFYFSGTGNSLYAAKAIAKLQGEKLVSIADEMKKDSSQRVYLPDEKELIGFVYPIYAWGPPKIVLDFIHTMIIKGENRYVFSLNTCGGAEGNATQMLKKVLMKKGMKLASAFSVSMPSNYIIGEDVEPQAVQQEKLRLASQKIEQINNILTNRQTDVSDLLRGNKPNLKTTLINPLFNVFARSTKPFSVTDACIHCGLCEKICPVNTITLKQKPVWGKACTQCLGCINRCPVQAIQYGNATKNRGRYLHPEMKASD